MVRFLAEIMPAVTVCDSVKGLPMASTQSPTLAESELPSFTVGSAVLASILMTAKSVALSTPITRAGRPRSWLSGSVDSYVDLVGLVDNVIVGDDVALAVDDEAGTQGFTNAALVVAVALVGSLPPKEAVEEVLKVVLAVLLILVVAAPALPVIGILRVGLHAAPVGHAPAGAVHGLLGQRLGVDIDDRRGNG